ncbi:MAG TPA: PAS domain S-box protein [Polyangiales bacterium]|nr:PAS domain S-box protein [Polyangiales bacterium]
MSADQHDLPALLLRALSESEPERCLQRVLSLLEALGFVRTTPDDPAASLTANGAGPGIALRQSGEPLSESHCELLRAALQTAVSRFDERAELRRAQERAAMLSAASFEGIIIHDNGVIIEANDRVSELLRCTREEVLGDGWMREVIAPEDLPGLLARIARGDEGEYLISGVRKDGTRFRAEFLAKQGKLGDRPVRVTAVRDVTERERTAELLRESETRLTTLCETAFDWVVLSRQGLIIDAAGDYEQALGYPRERVVGRPILDFVPAEVQELTRRVLAEYRVGGYETIVLDAHGNTVPVEIVGVSSTLNGEPVRVSAFRDLREARRLADERRELEAQIAQTQRLDSLGVLAGGIAHDFNNLLVGMLGNAELLQLSAATSEDREAAQAIQIAAQRAANLTSQMLAYAGARSHGEREPIEVESLCKELHALLEATLSKKARVELRIEPGCVVLAERTPFTQVLMNLLTNASDALDDEPGTVRVSARRVETPDARFQHSLGSKVGRGRWIQIEVSDDGIGMNEATQRRIFEPFFTTKPRGHGLGLAACLGIVSSHGGAIAVDSERGRGSRFSSLWPATEAGHTERAKPALAVARRPRKVLIVDDEAQVRSVMRRLLERSGHTVLEANGGDMGLRVLESARVDVVVLDVSMPDLDGTQVVHRLRTRGFRPPIILCSGNLDSVAAKLSPGQVQALLPKPFSSEPLLSAIERVCG